VFSKTRCDFNTVFFLFLLPLSVFHEYAITPAQRNNHNEIEREREEEQCWARRRFVNTRNFFNVDGKATRENYFIQLMGCKN
jgi:hypothetical protein